MNIITICARGGSAGVPGKNIRMLCGKPLIAWTIGQALEAGIADHVFVSTDSQDIADAAIAAGAEVPFLRPAELATATAGKLPVIQHLVEWVDGNRGPVRSIVDLDPTSPLRDVTDIQTCFKMLDAETDVVITVMRRTKTRTSTWWSANRTVSSSVFAHLRAKCLAGSRLRPCMP